MARSMGLFFKRGAHSVRYDVEPGKCCKIRDEEIQKCFEQKLICKPNRLPNRLPNNCVEKVSPLSQEYPMQLLRLFRSAEDKCKLYKHDVCHYEPSDKTRRYQRTWAECPLIWLRPRKICCPEQEIYMPAERRPRKPPRPPLSPVEKFTYSMELLCKGSQTFSKSDLKCRVHKELKPCEKVTAPFPSFSECNQGYILRYCDTECACKYMPSLCDVWRQYHRNSGAIKVCTRAVISNCPYKHRARPLY